MGNNLKDQTPLRIRFEKTVPRPPQTVMEKFKKAADELPTEFKIRQMEGHVWISMSPSHKKYYSPTLHLELGDAENTENTLVRGLFGPDPGLWTFFMFLHFVVAGIFIMFLTFAYSNWALKQSFILDLFVMGLMAIVWAALYFFARSNRKKGLSQARAMEKLVEGILEGPQKK